MASPENADRLTNLNTAARAYALSLDAQCPPSPTESFDAGWEAAQGEVERLRALVGRMLPYVQRWDVESPAETQVQITLEDDAERALTAHTHEPGEPHSCQTCGFVHTGIVGASRDASSNKSGEQQ